MSKSLAEKGLSKTVAKLTEVETHDGHMSKGISVYLVAAKPFKSKVVAKALDGDGQEIGRSTVDVDFAADDAKYVGFTFDPQMDRQLVAKYVLDLKK